MPKFQMTYKFVKSSNDFSAQWIRTPFCMKLLRPLPIHNTCTMLIYYSSTKIILELHCFLSDIRFRDSFLVLFHKFGFQFFWRKKKVFLRKCPSFFFIYRKYDNIILQNWFVTAVAATTAAYFNPNKCNHTNDELRCLICVSIWIL